MGRCPLFLPLAALIAIILIGDSTGLRRPQEPPAFGCGSYAAYILSIKDASTAGRLAVAEIDSVDGAAVSPFRTRIHFVSEFPRLHAAMRVRFNGKLRPLPGPPAVPDAVDMQANLRRLGVTASVVVPRDSVMYTAPTRSVRYLFAKASDAVLGRLMKCPLKPQTIDVLAAMLLGKSDMLTDDTRMAYSAAGLSHLLALSGMHVGIIAMIIAAALWPLYFGRHVRTRLSLTILALWLYAALTAFIPSVTRAVIMSTVFLAGRILERRTPPLNSLCLAAIVILLVTPSDLYSVGFQLSFAAVLGIILFFPLINRVDRHRHPRLYALASYPALSLSAMSLTGIVAAFHFHAFPLYFILANLLVAPLVPLLVFSGVISVMFNISGLTDRLADMIDSVARITASLPGAVIPDLYPPAWFVIVLSLLLCLLAWAISNKQRFWVLESLVLIAGVSACRLVAPRPVYPANEEYIVKEYRSTQRIVTSADSCFIYTDAILPSDRDEIRDRYTIMLRDFVARRRLAGPVMK